MNPDGMLALMKWEEETPYMYFFKHGLDEEKVVSQKFGFGANLIILHFQPNIVSSRPGPYVGDSVADPMHISVCYSLDRYSRKLQQPYGMTSIKLF
jgi:Translationally controlled tumour protein